jgi:hypothetical protein
VPLTPKDKKVKLKTLKDADLLRPMTINPEIRIMEDIIDELKAKHTEPSGVKLERLEKKFEPVEKILREGRLTIGSMFTFRSDTAWLWAVLIIRASTSGLIVSSLGGLTLLKAEPAAPNTPPAIVPKRTNP